MKHYLLKKFSLLLVISAACFTSFANSNRSFTSPLPEGDSITIMGKFISPCSLPKEVKIWKFNALNIGALPAEVPVNSNGEFSYHILISNPQELRLGVDMDRFDFITTLKEKTYNIEITCDNKQKKIEVKNSPENYTFSHLFEFNNIVKDSLEKLSKSGVLDENKFLIVRKLFLNYQDKVGALIKNNPETFTTRVLCPGEILTATTLSSFTALKENYLQREALSNPDYYASSFYFQNISYSYLFLLNKNDSSFNAFDKALRIACTNPVAAKNIEQIFYNNLYNGAREALLVSYINWAKLNPDDMYNQGVKLQLKNLENVVKGCTYTEIALTDPTGVERKLSETIASGKLTLVIFYSPTCSHCQENLPKLLPLWNQYKNKGFKIYTVGADATIEEWNDFIKNKISDEWTNVFENNASVRQSSKYMITSSPSFILIDKNGKIISRFETMQSLMKDVPDILNK